VGIAIAEDIVEGAAGAAAHAAGAATSALDAYAHVGRGISGNTAKLLVGAAAPWVLADLAAGSGQSAGPAKAHPTQEAMIQALKDASMLP
jgi:hypothetical protein